MASRDLTRSPHIIAIASIQATGTASSSTFLRGDGTWATPSTSAHSHAASDITSGTFDIARIPTGTSSTTVSLGNHNHDSAYATTGHTHSQYAATSHAHSASDLTSGTIDPARIPNVEHPPVAVTYASTIVIDPSLGTNFTISATGNISSLSISNTGAANGQMIVIAVLASSASRTCALVVTNYTTGLSGATTTIASGKVHFYGVRYSSLAGGWTLMASTQEL